MKVLVIAPHADDETIGLGGTIARYAAEGHQVTIAVVTGHGDGAHPLWAPDVWEVVRAEAKCAIEILGGGQLLFEEVPAALVADQPVWKLNEVTKRVVDSVQPEVLYVPFAYDLHKDHREIFHSLSIAWRPISAIGRGIKEIYCYETLSETHWNIPYVEPGFLPTCWVDISQYLETKLRALSCYKSQLRPSPDVRSIPAVQALAVLRGHQVGVHAAESFVAVRLLR